MVIILDSLNPVEPSGVILLLRLMHDKFNGIIGSDAFGDDGCSFLKRGSSSDIPNRRLCLGFSRTGCREKFAHAYFVI